MISVTVRKILLFLVMFAGLIFVPRVIDNDAWFLLNSGRYVLANGIPHVEPFTIHEGLHFVLSPWLTCVIFWKIYELFGSGGLLTFAGAVGALIIWMYYRLCLLVSDGNQQISRLLTTLTGVVTGCFGWITTRPQIFSTLFTLTEIFLLEKFARTKDVRYLYPLPVMSLVLVNLHASLWVMMVIVLLPYLAATFRFPKFDSWFVSGEISRRPLLLTLAGILLAGLCNPNGTEAMIYVLRSYDWATMAFISEIHSPTIHSQYGKVLFAWLAILVVMYTRKTAPLRYILLTAGLAVMGLQALRNLFLFFTLGTFAAAYLFRDVKLADPTIDEDTPHASRKYLLLLLTMLAWFVAYVVLFLIVISPDEVSIPLAEQAYLTVIAVSLLCILFDRSDANRFKLSALPRKVLELFAFAAILFVAGAATPKNAPTEEFYKPAVDALLQRESPENIILWTGFNAGGYTEFRGIRSYIDPRAEIFMEVNNGKKDILKEYLDLRGGETYYKDFFAKYNFTHALVTGSDIFVYQAVSHDPNFRLIYEYDGKEFDDDIICKVFEIVDRADAD